MQQHPQMASTCNTLHTSGQPVQGQLSPQQMANALKVAITQIVVALLCVIFQSVSTGYLNNNYHYYYHVDGVAAGIWCGLLFLANGVFGVVAFKNNNRGFMISTMVLSILSSLFCWVLLGFAAAGVNSWSYCIHYWCSRPVSYMITPLIMDSFLVVLSLLEFAITVRLSSYSSAAAGCRTMPITSSNGQQAIVVQQGGVMYPGAGVNYAAPGVQVQYSVATYPYPTMGMQQAGVAFLPQTAQQNYLSGAYDQLPPAYSELGYNGPYGKEQRS